MTWPTVTINQLNQQQGHINEIERTLLFIGYATTDLNESSELITLNSQSDISGLLSHASPALRANVLAAQRNAGQNWQAYAVLMSPDSDLKNWVPEVLAVQDVISVEGCVVVADINNLSTGRDLINAFSTLRNELIGKLGRWMWFILTVCAAAKMPPSTEGKDPGLTWAQYLTFLANLENGMAAPGVQLVPSLWGNEAGALGGRLCHRAVTIADSPARVKTGALIGLGADSADLPADAVSTELTLATLRAMHDLRYSVPMWYSDYEGYYWSDGLTLDAKGGDFQAIEYLRIVDKAARRIRLRAIAKIADRSMNSTPASIAAHKTYFAATLREMSRSTQINGVTFPGEIEPPKDDAVSIVWTNKEEVAVYLVITPYGSPKSISVGIMLDATLEG
ncbi:DUF2586 domain-containing protein [Photorhabdus tasmaniensis]|uniref:DUF2586 domain-containing protein n=1 Tax=Photorhabdus tasmaniensis TaxID=1004159 RepID=A0ABX0GG20_9GAMM|nr:DUF2586 domain-containing protein [Photorhabdus tasmaniensis]NHB87185.1 DUF2586 domain-containing protein [Photorhabdus tasmaniensis]